MPRAPPGRMRQGSVTELDSLVFAERPVYLAIDVPFLREIVRDVLKRPQVDSVTFQ